MAYSTDLRERVLDFIDAGNTVEEASRIFKVHRRTILRWRKLREATGTVARQPYRHGAIKLNDQEFIEFVEANPDLYLKDYAEHFNMTCAGIWCALKRLGITLKKTPLYRERDEKQRECFVKEISQYDNDKLIYIDESGVDQCLYRDKGWAPRGKKICGEVSGKKYERESFIAGKVGSHIIAPFCFKGTCNTAVFNTWVEKILLPCLKPGQIAIMDNASFHKSVKTKELIESVKCKLLFLPPYSPDLNPIEKFWANLKKSLTRIISRFGSLSDALDHLFKQECTL